ncbi:PTS lactose transporter subunit IIB [Nocardioides donggukensis]|uniref:PTS lactose transporter subunit IIB n=1 Tax=Nocardioides donggukensis TaxID=2774019 RepID=A0A927Q423_9ACTN|nr:PTS lactose transporter subunit IIB [Nocardioides donggukensis]MBD8871111.1 PTS lactose transporter subunit IIB [Nocardioides donggukensis]
MPTINGSDVRKVVIACDAGMGSSVMVATTMKKKLKKYDVDVVHTPVNEIPGDSQVVLCHSGLAARAAGIAPNAVIVPFQVFMGDPAFAKVESAIKQGETLES